MEHVFWEISLWMLDRCDAAILIFMWLYYIGILLSIIWFIYTYETVYKNSHSLLK